MVITRVGFESLPLPDNNVGEGSIADYELPLTSLSIGCAQFCSDIATSVVPMVVRKSVR